MAVWAAAKVVNAYALDKRSQRMFRKDGAFPYDERHPVLESGNAECLALDCAESMRVLDYGRPVRTATGRCMMRGRGIDATLVALREAWDRRARDNARHYVRYWPVRLERGRILPLGGVEVV